MRLWVLMGKAMNVVHAPNTSLGSKFKTVHFAIMARLVNQTKGVAEPRVDYYLRAYLQWFDDFDWVTSALRINTETHILEPFNSFHTLSLI